jgi:hypothetical protein
MLMKVPSYTIRLFHNFICSCLTLPCILTGEALSLHAGAYSSGPSESLHPEAPGHRRELYPDGHHTSGSTSSYLPSKPGSFPTTQWLVL